MSFKKTAGILTLGLLAAALILTTTAACSSKAKEGEAAKTGEVTEPVSQEMAIKEGLKDKDDKTLMKPVEGLSDDDIKGLVAYIRAFGKK